MSGDPFWSNVVLLMGFEGANGATSGPGLTDESPAVHGTGTLINVTRGNISTSQFEFGTSSLFINGTGGPSGLTFPDSNDWNFGAGLFTIETWVRLSTISGSQVFASQWGTSGQFGWQFGMTGASNLSWYVSTDGTSILTDIGGTWSPVANTWYHVAVDYDGTKYRVYVNGVMTGSSVTPRTIFNSNLALGIGSYSTGLNLMNGFVDELRITKGVARYASDGGFVVPTAAFPRGPAVTTFNVRAFGYVGLAQMDISKQQRFSDDLVWISTESPVWSQAAASNAATPVSIIFPGPGTDTAKVLGIEVADGNQIRYELQLGPNASNARVPGNLSRRMSGFNYIAWAAGSIFRFVDAASFP